MAANKHLVLDASVILDLWLRPERAMATEALFASAEQGRASLWVSAASLPTLEFIAVRRSQLTCLAACRTFRKDTSDGNT